MTVLLSILTIALFPGVSTAPATLELHLTLVPSEKNQRICVSLVSDTVDKATCWDPVGLKEPPSRIIRFYNLPAGHYTGRAVMKVGMDIAMATPAHADVKDPPPVSPRR